MAGNGAFGPGQPVPVRRQRWATGEELRLAIITWIERTYTGVGGSAGLAPSHPSKYETINRAATTAFVHAAEAFGYGGRMTRPPTGSPRTGSTAAGGAAIGSAAIDVCCVLGFVAIGRHTHHDGESIAGLWHTAWPFLGGLAIGLAAARAWRRPQSIRPAGLGAWLGAAGAGMVLRVLAGQGTALAFIVVALAFLGLFILGWRVLARIVTMRLQAAR